MAELADALALGASVARRGGSSPPFRTNSVSKFIRIVILIDSGFVIEACFVEVGHIMAGSDSKANLITESDFIHVYSKHDFFVEKLFS